MKLYTKMLWDTSRLSSLNDSEGDLCVILPSKVHTHIHTHTHTVNLRA